MLKKQIFNSAGYTLVELSLVLSLAALLSAYVLPDYKNVLDKAKEIVCMTQRKLVEEAEIIYEIENNYKKFATIKELVDSGMLTEMPRCPSGGEYYWEQKKPFPKLGCTKHSIKDN